MRAVLASFAATLLAAVALSAQATPSQQQQIEIDHCTIMSKAVLEFAKARDQGLAKMDAYNSVTGNQPYRAGSMVDQTLQWAYDHSDENAEAASAHFYGHCSLDALEALTPETEKQAMSLAATCQQQNAARPDETRICMDQKISELIAAANGPGLAPTSATAVAPRPAHSKVQTLSSAQLPVASAPSVRAPVAPVEAAPQAPVRLAHMPVPVSTPAPAVAAAPMPIPAPVNAKPAIPVVAPTAVAAAPAPAPLQPTVVPESQPTEPGTPETLAQAPTPVASASITPVTAPEPTPVAKPAVAPVVVAEAPPPVVPPLPEPAKAVQPTPLAPVVAEAPKPAATPTPQPVVPQLPTTVSAPAAAPVVAKAAAPAPAPEPARVAAAAPAASAAEPKLAVLSPPSLAGIGKLSLGMTMADAMHTFHSFGEEDRDEFGAETQTFVISGGHGYVVLLTEQGKPDTLYGIEYHGGADADTAPTIMGMRLGQSALVVLTHVGDPSRRERLPNSEFTRWYYDGRNYSFDISSGGDLVAIRLYGYQGLQAPDADSDGPAAAPTAP